MLQELTGGQAIELSKASLIMNPRWSPDGSELAVSNPPRGTFLTSRIGGPLRFIARSAYPCWSPDGDQIALDYQDERAFRIVNKVTGSTKAIRMRGFREPLDLDWSPASNSWRF